MATQAATIDRFTFDYLTMSQVARCATMLDASDTGVAMERVSFDCGVGEKAHPGMVHLACQYLDSHRAGRVITALRAADWSFRNRAYSAQLFSDAFLVPLAEIWSDRRRMEDDLIHALGDRDDEQAEMILLMNPTLFAAIFGSAGERGRFEDHMHVGDGREIRIVGLMHIATDQVTRRMGYHLGDSEAYLLRRDPYPQDPCRSTVQIHAQLEPSITAMEEDGQTRWSLVADEAVVIDPSCGFRFGCAPIA